MTLAPLLAYLLGSIPFGLLLTRMAGLGDIRKVGSGNIGATNVMRTGNKKLGIATLLLDGAKGYFAVWLAIDMGMEGEMLYVAAMMAVLGHVFPVWLKFRGGKGVATAFGVVLALNPHVGLMMMCIWLVVWRACLFVSVASILSFWAWPLASMIHDPSVIDIFLITLALLITWTHRANIKRLKAGTEASFPAKRSASGDQTPAQGGGV